MIYQKTFFNKSSGFTLIEVLITVVILSIGLLGMAGIQIQGLRGTTSSTVRSQATILANDIAERIHMNLNGVFVTGMGQNEHYSVVDTSNIACGTDVPALCSATPGGGSPDQATINTCATPEGMAEFDIYEFACGLADNAGVNNLLPNGSARITCNNIAGNCPPGSELTIDINWEETSTNDGSQLIKTVTMVVIP